MLEKRIKCLLVEPYELPEEIEIDNTLESKQELVGGWIEQAFLPKDDSVVLICNEEGKINRDIGHDIIFGYSDNRSKFILGLEQQDINSLYRLIMEQF